MPFDQTPPRRFGLDPDQAFRAEMDRAQARRERLGWKPSHHVPVWTEDDEAGQAAWRAERPRRGLLEG
jgi:hypothetical protein